MGTASARKKRKISSITSTSSSFSDSVHSRDSHTAAKIVFSTSLDTLGADGLIKALDRGNSFYQRKKRREEL